MTELEKQYKKETGEVIAISVAQHPFVQWLAGKYAKAKAGQHEIVVMGLLRELAIRGNYAFPQNEQEEVWFNEGIEQNMSGDFMHRLLTVIERTNS